MPPELQFCEARRDRPCMSFEEMVLLRRFQSGALFCKIQFRCPPCYSPANRITENKIRKKGNRGTKKKSTTSPSSPKISLVSEHFWSGIIPLIPKVIKTMSWLFLVFQCFQAKFGNHLWVLLTIPRTECVGWGKKHRNDSTPWSESKLVTQES